MSEERENAKHEAIAPQLFMRDTQTGRTLPHQRSRARGPGTGSRRAEVGFQAASADGSRVFFTDTARLTEESNQVPIPGSEANPADLYECEVFEEAGRPSCHLHDLTPNAIVGGGEVLNLIPGASEDGSYLYFIANGVLAAGASQGDCARSTSEAPPPGATCNLYLWHEGQTSFIATLSNEDSGDWGTLHGGGSIVSSALIEQRPDLADLTTRVSPNGRFLAFMSQGSLTDYDNEDTTSGHPGERFDEEVFLYDAQTKLLRCVSCNPDGQRPTGALDTHTPQKGNRRKASGCWSTAARTGSAATLPAASRAGWRSTCRGWPSTSHAT